MPRTCNPYRREGGEERGKKARRSGCGRACGCISKQLPLHCCVRYPRSSLRRICTGQPWGSTARAMCKDLDVETEYSAQCAEAEPEAPHQGRQPDGERPG
uniref:Uncharacterized protein n=1 Tax=Bionectria ochroleuca TaxID=29856 RepID=A0A8H7NF48_BIOOC